MTRILALSGSLRKGSYNSTLLRAARELHPQAVRIGSIEEIPLYNADLESAAFPATVERLKQQVVAADGVLLASPEYNNSVPGVLKNAIDWLSRPSPDIHHVFRNKPVAVIGASPGGFGTISAQTAWLPVWRALGARHWSGGRLLVSHAHKKLAEHGMLDDPDLRGRLEAFVSGFLEFCER
jgi:chromate reductase, NAD(P)H dehydrogenase (quinone)